jgi:hypothetical protein
MATYEEEESPGFLSEQLSNPYVSLPYAIGSGLLAAMTPGVARGVQAANAGIGIGLSAEKYAQNQQKKRRLSGELDKIMGGGQRRAPEPKVPQGAMAPDTRISEVDLPAGSPVGISARPQSALMTPVLQDYMRALARYGDSGAVAQMLGRVLTREPRDPLKARQGEAIQLPDGTWTIPNPAQTRTVTPPRPVFSTQGGEAVDSIFNEQSGQWETTRRPMTPAPRAPAALPTPEELALTRARTQQALAAAENSRTNTRQARSPEELDRIQSQAELNRARTEQVKNSIEIARTAKTQTTGQLASALTALNNMLDVGTDPERKELVEDAKTRVLHELARRTPEQEKNRQLTAEAKTEMRKTAPNMSDADFRTYLKTDRGAQNLAAWTKHLRTRGQPSANDPLGIRGGNRTGEVVRTPTGNEKPGAVFEKLPDPGKFKGRSLTNHRGERVISDGRVWRDAEGRMVPEMLERRTEW